MPTNFLIFKSAARTTLICLISCLTGNWGALAIFQINMENDGMPQHHNMPMGDANNISMFSTIGLAMLSGLLISILFVCISLKYQNKQTWKAAFSLAINMSFISMILMMVLEYTVRFMLQPPNTNIMQVIHSLNYFDGAKASLISVAAITSGYLASLSYNYYMLKTRGISCH